jgi:uncharacterized membrane protein YsdA (DUF1294 family)
MDNIILCITAFLLSYKNAVILYLVLVNLTAFLMMGTDKRKAQTGKWRIPERTLFIPVLLGGSIGGMLGMRIFHHKTKHWKFKIGFPMIFLLQLTAVGCIIYYNVFKW